MVLPEGPKCPKGAEVVGAEVVGAEVTINHKIGGGSLKSIIKLPGRGGGVA